MPEYGFPGGVPVRPKTASEIAAEQQPAQPSPSPSPVPPNPTGSKYLRSINPADGVGQSIRVDVYSVLAAFSVTCPARAHAVKKLLCAGLRGKGDSLQDLRETIDAVNRAIALEGDRVRDAPVIVAGLSPEQKQSLVDAIRGACGPLRPTTPDEQQAIMGDSPLSDIKANAAEVRERECIDIYAGNPPQPIRQPMNQPLQVPPFDPKEVKECADRLLSNDAIRTQASAAAFRHAPGN